MSEPFRIFSPVGSLFTCGGVQTHGLHSPLLLLRNLCEIHNELFLNTNVNEADEVKHEINRLCVFLFERFKQGLQMITQCFIYVLYITWEAREHVLSLLQKRFTKGRAKHTNTKRAKQECSECRQFLQEQKTLKCFERGLRQLITAQNYNSIVRQ